MARTALFTLLVAAASCGAQLPAAVGSPPAPSVTSSAGPTAVPVESTDATQRTACALRVFEQLVRAFNAGDAAALERTIGAGPLMTQSFQWASFADSSGRHGVYNPEGAAAVLVERSAQGERLTLTSLRSNEGPSWHGGVDVAFSLESRTPRGTKSLVGKAALSCVAGRIYVLSVGAE